MKKLILIKLKKEIKENIKNYRIVLKRKFQKKIKYM